MIHEHQCHHGFGNRRGPDADTGIVTTIRLDSDRIALLVDRSTRNTDIVVTIGIKPTSSIRVPRRTIDKHGNAVVVETNGRHDPCVGIRATPIAEAMMALVLMDCGSPLSEP